MRGKNTLGICLISMLIITVMVDVGITSPTTKIVVAPSTIIDRTGSISEFFVYVNVTSVDELYGWSFRMLFNPTIVKVTGAVMGTWLADASGWPALSYLAVRNDLGYVFPGQLLDPFEYPTNGATGSGNLVTITFEVIGTGVTALELDKTVLNTVIGGQKWEIEHEAKNGLFDNRPETMAPHAFFKVDGLRVEKGPLTFDASASHDDYDKGWIESYEWDFDYDGIAFEVDATGEIVTHSYPSRGTYTAMLRVTDNDNLTDSFLMDMNIVVWMDGGDAPDLVGWEAKPEHPRLNEGPDARGMDLRSFVGNPTEDPYEVYVEFTLYSKDEAKELGTLTTETITLDPGEKTELRAYFDASDPMWRCFSGSPEWVTYGYYHWLLHKYIGFASCYYWNGTTFVRGNVVKYISFNVAPLYHNIGVVDVTAFPTTVTPGDTIEINVTVMNMGDLEESVNLDLSYVGIGGITGNIDSTMVTLSPGENKTLTFTWTTTGLAPGPYLIKAKLPMLPYEKEIGDNSLSTKISITA